MQYRDDQDICAETEYIRNIKASLLRLALEQRGALCQYNTDTSCECIRNDERGACENITHYLPFIITFVMGLTIVVSLSLYFGDVLCNNDKAFVNPPPF